MSNFLTRVQELIDIGEVRISEHGYDVLAEDELTAKELIAGVKNAIIIEEYPDYSKGPCVLTLQHDKSERSVHVVWGIPKGNSKPVVLVTAYRPAPEGWDESFSRRR